MQQVVTHLKYSSPYSALMAGDVAPHTRCTTALTEATMGVRWKVGFAVVTAIPQSLSSIRRHVLKA